MSSMPRPAMLDNVTCPQCGKVFPITETLHHQLLDTVRKELLQQEAEVHRREEQIRVREQQVETARKEVEAQVAAKLANERAALEFRLRQAVEQEQAGVVQVLKQQITEQQQAITAARVTELDLRKKQHELEQRQGELQLEVERKVGEQKAAIEQETRRRADEEHAAVVGRLHHQLSEQQQLIERARAAEEAVQQQQRAIQERAQALDVEVQRKVVEQKAAIETAAKSAAAMESQAIVESLQAEVEKKQEELTKARLEELELRRRERELDERQKMLELEVERKLAEARHEAETRAEQRLAEQYELKKKESDEKVQDLTRQINDLKRRAEQGSQQSQGEFVEKELAEMLAAAFPADEIVPVPKGVHGADVIQKITEHGRACGTILWEVKNTKNWSSGWVAKLREDQVATNADVAIVMTAALPKEIKTFGRLDDVWVTSYECAPALAAAIRLMLLQVARIERLTAAKNETVEVLFQYVTSPEFQGRVQAMATAFREMRAELEQEKAAAYKRWAKREKQIGTLTQNTAMMFGHLQGLIGPQMRDVPALEEPEDGGAEAGPADEEPGAEAAHGKRSQRPADLAHRVERGIRESLSEEQDARLTQNTAMAFGHLQGLIGPQMRDVPALEEPEDGGADAGPADEEPGAEAAHGEKASGRRIPRTAWKEESESR